MRKVFIVLAIFLLSFGLFAEGQPVIAVFHFENETQSGKFRLSDNTLRIIEEKIRIELIKTHRFEVMTEDRMESAIRQHKEESYNSNRDRDYQIELGRKISARYIVIGKIRNDKQDYTVFAEMIDTQRESSKRAGQADFVNKKESYNKAVDSIVSQFLGEDGKQSSFAKPSGQSANSKDWKACEYARKKATVTAWNSYLEIYPQGECASEAKDAIDDIACNHAEQTKTIEGWQLYLKHQPKGNCAVEAKGEIKELQRKYIGKHKIGNLIWSDRSSNKMNWSSAKQYCEDLTEGGYSDWRLPNIDELRTTIKNCSKAESGGECKVSEKNGRLSSNDWEPKGSCYCDYKGNNGGYYSRLGDDDKVLLWSSSPLSDGPDYAWYVHFYEGYVGYYGKSGNFYVRCVR